MEDQGTALQAIRFALDHCASDSEAMRFLRDWNACDLDEWPEYKAFLQADAKAAGRSTTR